MKEKHVSITFFPFSCSSINLSIIQFITPVIYTLSLTLNT